MSIIQRLIEGLQNPNIHVEWLGVPQEVMHVLRAVKKRRSGALFKLGEDLGYGLCTINRVFVVMTIPDQPLATIRLSFHGTGHLLTCILNEEEEASLNEDERRSLTDAKKELYQVLTKAMSW